GRGDKNPARRRETRQDRWPERPVRPPPRVLDSRPWKSGLGNSAARSVPSRFPTWQTGTGSEWPWHSTTATPTASRIRTPCPPEYWWQSCRDLYRRCWRQTLVQNRTTPRPGERRETTFASTHLSQQQFEERLPPGQQFTRRAAGV